MLINSPGPGITPFQASGGLQTHDDHVDEHLNFRHKVPMDEVLFKLLLIIYTDLFKSVISNQQQNSTFSVGEDPT